MDESMITNLMLASVINRIVSYITETEDDGYSASYCWVTAEGRVKHDSKHVVTEGRVLIIIDVDQNQAYFKKIYTYWDLRKFAEKAIEIIATKKWDIDNPDDVSDAISEVIP